MNKYIIPDNRDVIHYFSDRRFVLEKIKEDKNNWTFYFKALYVIKPDETELVKITLPKFQGDFKTQVIEEIVKSEVRP